MQKWKPTKSLVLKKVTWISRNHLVKLLCTKKMLHQHAANQKQVKSSAFSSPFRPKLETIFRMSKPNGVTPSPFWVFQPLREIPVFSRFFFRPLFGTRTRVRPETPRCARVSFRQNPMGRPAQNGPVVSSAQERQEMIVGPRWHILQGSTNIRKCEQSNMLN